MGAVVKARAFAASELQVGLVDERSRVQRGRQDLATALDVGRRLKLVLHQGETLPERLAVSRAKAAEQRGDGGLICHEPPAFACALTDLRTSGWHRTRLDYWQRERGREGFGSQSTLQNADVRRF